MRVTTLILLLLVTTCGQKGALELPNEPAEPPSQTFGMPR